jgi:FADH2 O2-dependent halogenase
LPHYDVAIVGSGFAGSILARVLRRQGRRVLLVEKGRHPRFAIGESTTPLANLALERLASRYGLADLGHLAAWGRWRTHLPHLGRGLKRGFTFYRHERGRPYRNSAANEARLLVAASPSDAVADTHWLRADVDRHLVERAVEEGVDYLDETELEEVELGSRVRLAGRRRGERVRASAEWLVDGSGPGGLLARSAAAGLAPALDRVPIRSGLVYSHFDGAASFVDLARRAGAAMEPGPYPDEKAAVHHLLDGVGWMYVLPFDHGPVSAGVVLFGEPEYRGADEIWREVLAAYPTLGAQLGGARPLRPLTFVGRLQHRLSRAAGERFFLLPHTFAFYEPLFSTGMAWSLLAVERLAGLFEGRYGDAAAYGDLLAAEADRIGHLVETAYRAMDDFELFTAASHLYFVTVSVTELRQRLFDEEERPFAWQGFLGTGDPFFDELFRDVRERLAVLPRSDVPAFTEWLAGRLAPRNVVGLADPARRNLYPVDLDVLVDRASLLGLSCSELRLRLPRLRGE